MGCKQKTVKFAKHVWAVLGPKLAPHVAESVALVNKLAPLLPDLLTGGHAKRKFVLDMALAEAKIIGHDAFDDAKEVTIAELKGAIRTQLERSVFLLNGAAGGWEDTMDMSDEDQPLSV
jgi:hypothetical protein